MDYDTVIISCLCPYHAHAQINDLAHTTSFYRYDTGVFDAIPIQAADDSTKQTVVGTAQPNVVYTWKVVDAATGIEPSGLTDNWSSAGDGGFTFTPPRVGEYIIELTVSNGCETTSDTVRVEAKCSETLTSLLHAHVAGYDVPNDEQALAYGSSVMVNTKSHASSEYDMDDQAYPVATVSTEGTATGSLMSYKFEVFACTDGPTCGTTALKFAQ